MGEKILQTEEIKGSQDNKSKQESYTKITGENALFQNNQIIALFYV